MYGAVHAALALAQSNVEASLHLLFHTIVLTLAFAHRALVSAEDVPWRIALIFVGAQSIATCLAISIDATDSMRRAGWIVAVASDTLLLVRLVHLRAKIVCRAPEDGLLTNGFHKAPRVLI